MKVGEGEGGLGVGDDGADVERGAGAGAVGAEEGAGVEGGGVAEEVEEDGLRVRGLFAGVRGEGGGEGCCYSVKVGGGGAPGGAAEEENFGAGVEVLVACDVGGDLGVGGVRPEAENDEVGWCGC